MSKRVGGGGSGIGCLGIILGFVAVVLALGWPYMVWHTWAVEAPYLVVVGGLIVWGWVALIRWDRRKYGRTTKRPATRRG